MTMYSSSTRGASLDPVEVIEAFHQDVSVVARAKGFERLSIAIEDGATATIEDGTSIPIIEGLVKGAGID